MQSVAPPIPHVGRHHSEPQPQPQEREPQTLPALSAVGASASMRPQTQRSLSAVRSHVLSYLSDLETDLTLLDFKSQSHSRATSPGPSPRLAPATASDSDIESIIDDDAEELDLHTDDVSKFVHRGFQMLATIRDELSHHLPEYDFPLAYTSARRASVDSDREGMAFRARAGRSVSHSVLPPSGAPDPLRPTSQDFARIPSVPSMPTSRAPRRHLSGLMSDANRFFSRSESAYLDYIPQLQARLSSLQQHMKRLETHNPYVSAMPIITPMQAPQIISDLIKDLMEEDTPEAIAADMEAAQKFEETTHQQIERALLKSENGRLLINYDDLPYKWRNNEFVLSGYRFIPGSKWRSILISIFEVHNETANIHTHLLPLISLLPLTWVFLRNNILSPEFSAALESYFAATPLRYFPALLPTPPVELDFVPETFFVLSAACCLLCSSIWHTFAGCASDKLAEGAARVDYIGIGWLISASVQSMIYYGFGGSSSHPPSLQDSHLQGAASLTSQITPLRAYTALCIMTGAVASIVPFQAWFNERKNKKWRIVFFLGLAFASLLPLTHLSIAKGPINTLFFVLPCVPSWLSYVAGLVFYATHFPESVFPGHFDVFSSHAIWHVFIVIAVRIHYISLSTLKEAAPAFLAVKADWREISDMYLNWR